MTTFQVTQLQPGGFDDNFSYLLYAPADGATAVIDPCGSVAVITAALAALPRVVPTAILLTHGHHDHTSGVAELRRTFPAPVCAHALCTFKPDRALSDRERLPFGPGFIECLHAPGHTRDSVLYRLGDDSALFTGDTLFIDCCGYGQPEVMYRTMREVIFPLADRLIVYSGHHYGREPFGTLGVEKVRNPFLAAALKPLNEFKEQLKLL